MNKVAVLDLSVLEQKIEYEKLMNDVEVDIQREQFSYVGKDGKPKVTVWYEIDDEVYCERQDRELDEFLRDPNLSR